MHVLHLSQRYQKAPLNSDNFVLLNVTFMHLNVKIPSTLMLLVLERHATPPGSVLFSAEPKLEINLKNWFHLRSYYSTV